MSSHQLVQAITTYTNKVKQLLTQKSGVIVNTGPGPSELISGDPITGGFYGEVHPSQLIGPYDLIKMGGLTGVGIQITHEGTWLKYAYRGRICYIAKKPILRGVHWQYFADNGMLSGERIFKIGVDHYTISLPDPPWVEFDSNGNSLGYLPGSQGTYRDLICRSHLGNGIVSDYGPSLAHYSDQDLLTHRSVGLGAYTATLSWSWPYYYSLQETGLLNHLMGGDSFDRHSNYIYNEGYEQPSILEVGWRPVLWLV